MVVPIDLLNPILEDLLTLECGTGRLDLGLVSMPRGQHKCVVFGLSSRSGAKGRLRTGDVVLAWRCQSMLAAAFAIWALGSAGGTAETSYRDGRTMEMKVASAIAGVFARHRVHESRERIAKIQHTIEGV